MAKLQFAGVNDLKMPMQPYAGADERMMPMAAVAWRRVCKRSYFACTSTTSSVTSLGPRFSIVLA